MAFLECKRMKKIRSINKVLIANRGEIASRVMRSCKDKGITTVAVYSDADKGLPYVNEADMAVCLGGNTPTESYLNIEKVIDVAKHVGADAIHPGYGFLAENADFAEICIKNDLVFIGPSPKAISLMGLKSTAKQIMSENGVPVIPGYMGKDQSTKKLVDEAKKVG